MRHLRASFLYLMALVSIFAVSFASADRVDEKSAHQPPPDVSSAELNRIKALAGKWTSTTSMFGKKDEKVFTEYTVTA